MLRFHLSNWEVFAPTPPHQLKKKEKITDSSFQDSHLSPHLYICFLSNFLAWHGFSGLLICGVMLGKEGTSLQLIPLSLIINSWTTPCSYFLSPLDNFLLPVKAILSLCSGQIQKRTPKFKIIYIFPLSHLSKFVENFLFFHIHTSPQSI